jgi:CubicO group peptidase (beta-lactamase class C family)
MPTLVASLTDIQDRLDALARQHGVPGATLAVGLDGELLDFATGVINVNTGVATTPTSVFQIGSNTKLFTATLVMQLVDSGAVDLDQPVRRYLPDFSLADPTGTEQITVRQLLTHSSGIQGDYFKGFGRGDEAIERLVASLIDIDLVHPPGQL